MRDSASKSGHSLRSFAEILSNPVAFDLQSFDSSAKTRVGVVFSKTKFLSVAVNTKQLFTEVEMNNCFSLDHTILIGGGGLKRSGLTRLTTLSEYSTIIHRSGDE